MTMSKINPQINQIQIKLERIISLVENAKNPKAIRNIYRELIELYAIVQSIAM